MSRDDETTSDDEVKMKETVNKKKTATERAAEKSLNVDIAIVVCVISHSGRNSGKRC